MPYDDLDNSRQVTIIGFTMTVPSRIVLDPAICRGKPIIRGTRLPVTVVVGSLAGGMTFEEVQREYDLNADELETMKPYRGSTGVFKMTPTDHNGLTADDIRAALRFVGELAEQESFHPLPAN